MELYNDKLLDLYATSATADVSHSIYKSSRLSLLTSFILEMYYEA